MRGRTGTGRRRSGLAWRALVEGYRATGLSLERYCEREGIGIASYHRWRRLLAQATPAARAGRRSPTKGVAVAPTASGAFVDLGTLPSASSRVELRLDLGGGVMLQIARG